MKVLWVCNTLPATVARVLHKTEDNKEGWLDGTLGRMSAEADVSNTLTLAIAYPSDPSGTNQAGNGTEVSLNDMFKVNLYGYSDDRIRPEIYNCMLEGEFERIIIDFDPDIIHVFGTEYGHNLAVSRVRDRIKTESGKPSLLIGLQGIISECAKEYTAGMPQKAVESKTLRDVLRDDNVARQQEKFAKRGEFEKEAVTYATDITGRTSFDRNWSKDHSPNARYHHMNETLRSKFYSGTWDITECDRHVIFMSQGDYPLKGVHNVLVAMATLKEKYPDCKLVVAGANITVADTPMQKLKLSGYGRYLRQLIDRYDLKDHVCFTGPLNADQMKDIFLKCHTYLCASSLENSPNSMGEAMLLGVPVVASRTGGIPSMIKDDEEGLLYDSIEDMTEAMDKIWSDDAYATELGAHGMARAKVTHDPDTNYRRLIEIYEEIC